MFRSLKSAILLSAVLFLCIHGCSKDEEDDPYLDEPLCDNNFIPKTSDYKVTGFYPSWRKTSLPVSDIQYDKLTRIVYCFAVPGADGSIDVSDIEDVSDLVDEAHEHGVEVYFSVGGGDGSTNFAWIAADEKCMSRFVDEVCDFVFRYCLDGVDIDWEYWSGYRNNMVVQSESSAFVYIIRKISEKLSPFGKGISIDVGASNWSGAHFYTDVVQYVDDVQVMCYDFTGPWSAPGPHSSYEQSMGSGSSISSTGLAYWVNYRKWPKEKILLGVPFYGRDFDSNGGDGVTYSEIVKLSDNAYLNDRISNIYYNGIITMAEKTRYVVDNDYSGIMIWEIGQDSSEDSTSLLNAIDNIVNP